MDKTYNIGLGGFSFIMEESAFNDLKNYIATLRQKWSEDEGREEIIADIEYRMGELLQEHLKGKEVADREDIKYLIYTMGMPNDLADDDLTENYAENGFSASRTSASTSTNTFANKKLYRNPYHRILGGVASGLANYFGIDRVWIRLALVLAPFLDIVMMGISTSSLIILYIIAWIVIPKATTVSDMLQAKGEPVNAETIKEFKAANGELPPPRESFFRSALKILLKIIILTILISLVAVVLFIGFTVIGAIFFGSITIDYLPLLTENTWSFGVASTALIIALASIITGLILLSIKLISSSFRVHKAAKIAIPIILIGSIITLFTLAGIEARNFTAKSLKTNSIPLAATPNDTLIFSFNKEFDSNTFLDDDYAMVDNKNTFDFINSKDAKIVVTKTSRGKNFKDAQETLSKLKFPIKVLSNEIEIPNYFTLGKNTPFRNQEVDYYIHLPNNVPFVVKGARFVEQRNQNHTYITSNESNKPNGTPRVFMFIDGELKCTNCTDDDVEDEDSTETDNDSISIDGENLKLKADGKNENVELEIPGKIKIEADGKQQKVKIKLPDGKEIVNINE
ncbi:PspC domain-containing protein [Ornithobacterium rhinotracheale]|uniref:PspC domain-containing protein n=1 Tax=Ornithobacterium rhinotracheale TaxID=28251 RepID=A0A3R5XUD2_ORNRH|nr:PspC domain-containing protein [Ornithobacterium rhinotracheale]QAR31391.1 PspC domain-containing protein [Ornithobacterium rhinotracheale]